MGCKQRIEETLKKTQLNKAVTWIIGEGFFLCFFFFTHKYLKTLRLKHFFRALS